MSIGFVTDGEFNSLRTKGNHRPVSVIQLLMDAKAEAKSTPSRQIESYLTPTHRGMYITIRHSSVGVCNGIIVIIKKKFSSSLFELNY